MAIFVCILFLGILIPSAAANRPIKLSHRHLMVFGDISNFKKIGDNIIGHTKLLVYYGRGILNQDRGISIDQNIILKIGQRTHTWIFGSHIVILGPCIRLNFINFLNHPLFESQRFFH
jgi:hypothetical protein